MALEVDERGNGEWIGLGFILEVISQGLLLG